MLGDIGLQQGRLHQAEQYYRQLLVSAKGNPVDQMAAQLGMAKVFYEWNHLAEAEQSVAQVLELGKAHLDELGLFFSSRRRHTRSLCDWSSDVCSSDLPPVRAAQKDGPGALQAVHLPQAGRTRRGDHDQKRQALGRE